MKQTNSLQKSYNPFSNGRWYRIFIESNGTVSKATESDLENVRIDGNALIFDKKLLTFIEKTNLIQTDSVINTSINYYVHTDNKSTRYSLYLPRPNQFDHCEIFLFCED